MIRTALLLEDKIWFVQEHINYAYTISLNSWIVEKVCELYKCVPNNVMDMFIDMENIWFALQLGEHICRYDMKKNKVVQYDGSDSEIEFSKAILMEGNIYLVPKKADEEMCVFSIRSKEFYYEKQWKQQTEKYCIRERIRAVTNNKNSFVFTLYNSGIVARYDLKEKKMQMIEEHEKNKYLFAFYDEEKIYYTIENNRKIKIWGDDMINDVKCPYSNENHYVNVKKMKKKLLLQDNLGNFDEFDLDNYTFRQCIEIPKDFNEESNGWSLYAVGLEKDNTYYFLPYHANNILEIVSDEKKCMLHKVDYDFDKDTVRMNILYGPHYKEMEGEDLKIFIKVITE